MGLTGLVSLKGKQKQSSSEGLVQKLEAVRLEAWLGRQHALAAHFVAESSLGDVHKLCSCFVMMSSDPQVIGAELVESC